jgi:hypothetical protein
MTAPALALQIGLIVWLSAFAARVLYRLMIGQISMSGMLLDQPTGVIHSDRLQLLVASVAGAVTYVGLAIKAGGFPEIPEWLLTLLGGSQGIYLFGKKLRNP